MGQDTDVARVAAALRAPAIKYRSFGNEAVRAPSIADQPVPEARATVSPVAEPTAHEHPVEHGWSAPPPAGPVWAAAPSPWPVEPQVRTWPDSAGSAWPDPPIEVRPAASDMRPSLPSQPSLPAMPAPAPQHWDPPQSRALQPQIAPPPPPAAAIEHSLATPVPTAGVVEPPPPANASGWSPSADTVVSVKSLAPPASAHTGTAATAPAPAAPELSLLRGLDLLPEPAGRPALATLASLAAPMAAPAEASGAAVPDPGHDFPLIGALDLPALSGGRRHVVALRPEEIAASVAEPAMAEASETMSVAERVAESLPPREERVRPAPAPVLRAAEVRVSLSELLTLLATGAAAPDEAFAALHLPARQADA